MDKEASAVSEGRSLRLLAGVLAGLAIWLMVGAAGFGVLRFAWADYAIAEPNKAYSSAMLLARLTVGLMCTVAAGGVAAKVARSRSAAWWLGAFLLISSTPIHLVSVWADYPAWYHFAYLLPLMPIAGLGGGWASAAPAKLCSNWASG